MRLLCNYLRSREKSARLGDKNVSTKNVKPSSWPENQPWLIDYHLDASRLMPFNYLKLHLELWGPLDSKTPWKKDNILLLLLLLLLILTISRNLFYKWWQYVLLSQARAPQAAKFSLNVWQSKRSCLYGKRIWIIKLIQNYTVDSKKGKFKWIFFLALSFILNWGILEVVKDSVKENSQQYFLAYGSRSETEEK